MRLLVIDAKDGVAYQASAVLHDAHGEPVAEGWATLAPRGGLPSVRAGRYRLRNVHQLPPSGQVRHEWGTHGFIFEPMNRPDGEPLLLHGGDMRTGSHPRAVHGSVRVDGEIVDALLDSLKTESELAEILLTVRIGDAPRPWQFWRRPAAASRVPDQGLDVWDVLYPEVAPFRHPNSATAWLLYFRHEDSAHTKIVSGQGGDYAGGGASGAWDGETVAEARTAPETPTRGGTSHVPGIAAAAAPLFTVPHQEGIDRFGRVVHASSSEELPTLSTPIGAALAAGLAFASSDVLERDAHSAFIAAERSDTSEAGTASSEREASGGEEVQTPVELSTSY